ncbi:transglutaminase-like domain-containing protein [Demequina pelophila]|uniref:transglutaminase-like domain-containing protein n=1 Tax=Demequina pelophila TaxID=1638984 RepID=UPI0007825FF0|nr:transglutaminase family protein [Demequina pelophila]
MPRHVSSLLGLHATGPVRLVLAIAVAPGPDGDEGLAIDEELVVEHEGVPVPVEEAVDQHGTRLHLVDVDEGEVEVRYRARVAGRAAPAPVDPLDTIRYLRPSRYCESDILLPTAIEMFGALSGLEQLRAVTDWVRDHLTYAPGASGPTDGATATLLARAGVCRDFAHVVVAHLRALDVPARTVAVYAPGLEPMDFHAVVEALVDGEWHVVDATGLAPREVMVRVATGRDAADIAFLTTIGAPIVFERMEVTARAESLPKEDPRAPVLLG